MPPPDDQRFPGGGNQAYRLSNVENTVRDLGRKLDDIRDKSDERHEENRDKLNELQRQLDANSAKVQHLSDSVDKVGKAAWTVVAVVVGAIVIAVLKLVGPSLGARGDELPRVEQHQP
jgi:hypothetical protein